MNRWWGIAGVTGLALALAGGTAALAMRRLTGWGSWIALAGVALLLVYAYGNGRRLAAALAGRQARGSANAAVSVLLVLGIVAMVEAIGVRHSKRFDLTANDQFSLSPQSAKLVAGLDQEVEAVCFYKESQEGRQELEDLLESYRHEGPRFKYRFVDPDRQPGDARRYDVASYGTTVLVSGSRQERAYGTTEREITNALIKVTREGTKKFCFLGGHGERGVGEPEGNGMSALKQNLERENFTTEELLLLRTTGVPADCDVLVVAGPKSDLLPSEAEAIDRYLQGGGRALVMADPGELPALETMLLRHGAVLDNDIVVDTMSRMFGGDYLMPIVSRYEPHEITRNFALATFFPVARSVELAEPPPDGVEGTLLAYTGAEAWGESDRARLEKERKVQFDAADRQGPVALAAVLTREAEAKDDTAPPREMRLVVFGDSDFATNAYLMTSGNGNLVLNAMSWLAEEEDLVAIRPKLASAEPLFLTATQGRLIFLLPVVVMPLALLVAGAVVVTRRRWRR